MQGPAELLPVSSSGHLVLVPRLLGWSYAELPADVRKTFEVALHAGSAPALVVALRGAGAGDPLGLALTLGPPAVIGLVFESPIERRLGRMRSVATAQVVAGAALLGADLWAERRAGKAGRSRRARAAQRGRPRGAAAERGGRREHAVRQRRAAKHGSRRGRPAQERSTADARDHLAVGLAQAIALAPGVSRSGAALTVARLRGLSRAASLRLSLRAALPVTVAAATLKGVRMAGGSPSAALRDPELRAPLVAGAGAALVSTLASLPLLGLAERRVGLRALACYRIALGVTALSLNRRPAGSVGPLYHRERGN